MKVSTKLTSIKIIENIYKQFKSNTVNTKMNLQKLVNRSVYMYNTNESFKDELNNTTSLIVSGSRY